MELLNMVPTWVLILVLVVIVIGAIVMLVNYLKDKNLEKIRVDVYKLFLKAEHNFKESKAGQQKLKWVVQQARGLLPKWVQSIVSEATMMQIVNEWFKGIKDLLDDGKMNGSAEE